MCVWMCIFVFAYIQILSIQFMVKFCFLDGQWKIPTVRFSSRTVKGLCYFHVICIIICSNPLYILTLIFLRPILILSFHLLLGLLGDHFSKVFLIQILCKLLNFINCNHCLRLLPSGLTQGVQSWFITLYTINQQACDSPLGDIIKWYSVLPCSCIYW